MATTYYWIGGSGSKSFTSMTNWSATEGGVSAAGPIANGDTLVITTGVSTIDQDLSNTSLDLNSLYIGSSFTGTIGTSSASLTLHTIAAFIFVSPAVAYIGSTSTVTYAAVYSTYGSPLHLSFAAWTDLYITSGTVFIDSFNTGNLHILGGSVVLAAVTATCVINQYAGTLLCYALMSAGPLNLYGGIATTTGIYGGGAKIPTVSVYPNARYNYQTPATITTLTVFPGGLASCGQSAYSFTMTNSNLYAGGSMFDDSHVTITKTNPTTHYGFP